jgi:hypothetical protein
MPGISGPTLRQLQNNHAFGENRQKCTNLQHDQIHLHRIPLRRLRRFLIPKAPTQKINRIMRYLHVKKSPFREPGIEELRRVWQQAMEDGSPGIPADEVLDRLERKYQAIADATGAREECA